MSARNRKHSEELSKRYVSNGNSQIVCGQLAAWGVRIGCDATAFSPAVMPARPMDENSGLRDRLTGSRLERFRGKSWNEGLQSQRGMVAYVRLRLSVNKARQDSQPPFASHACRASTFPDGGISHA